MDKLVIDDSGVTLNGQRLDYVTAIDIHMDPGGTTAKIQVAADVALSEVARIECRQTGEPE